jgi:DNA-binding XRE family transcriptional regulator
MELGLPQRSVARILDATLGSVTAWENNKCGPRLALIPKVIEFLGYWPFSDQGNGPTFGGPVRASRRRLGVSQKQLGQLLGVDQTTISNWERGANAPRGGFPRLSALLAKLQNELTGLRG